MLEERLIGIWKRNNGKNILLVVVGVVVVDLKCGSCSMAPLAVAGFRESVLRYVAVVLWWNLAAR